MEKNKNVLRIIQGFKNIMKNKRKGIILLIFLIGVFVIWKIGQNFLPIMNIQPLGNIYFYIFAIFLTEGAIIGLLGLLIVWGTPKNAKRTEENLLQIKFVDSRGEPPMLLTYEKNMRISTYQFYSPRIPIRDFERCKEEIENALNVKIIDIAKGKDMQHILVKAVSASYSVPKKTIWDDTRLSAKDFQLRLGISLLGMENIDLREIPHCLIGGSTGSGKSALFKLLLMQCIEKGADVLVADFKGISFTSEWHERCKIVIDEDAFLEQLSNINDIMTERKNLFASAECESIEEYNSKENASLKRIIVATDEIAEVLDKGNKNKKQIESFLSTIGRMGRAYGIHLIIATQRPDSEILNGQIRSNIDFRICGRADKILSQIIIDSSDAAEVIPKDAQGRFLTNTGVEFQAFYVEGNYFLK